MYICLYIIITLKYIETLYLDIILMKKMTNVKKWQMYSLSNIPTFKIHSLKKQNYEKSKQFK